MEKNDKYKEFMGELIILIAGVVPIPMGEGAEEWVKNFVRIAVQDKLDMMKQ